MKETLKLESLQYTNGIKVKIFITIVILLFGFSFIATLFPTHPNNNLGHNLFLITIFICLIGFFYRYYFEKPCKTGEILIDYDKLILFETIKEIGEIEFIGVYYHDYRGRFKFERSEYPLPKFGLNNKIKVITKTRDIIESNFIVRRKKDRKLIDKYINYWIKKGINVQYCIDETEIVRK